MRGIALKLRQLGSSLEVRASSSVGESSVREYLRLDDPLPDILAEIGKDEAIREAIKRFYGLRLLRQDPWECLASYICATNASIPAIRRMVKRLCELLGERIKFEGCAFYSFPSAEAIAEAGPERLRACGLGYRAPYLASAAEAISSGELKLEELRAESYEMARRELLALPGVGPKVADCVLLFSLEKLEAFPLDVWTLRAITELYPHLLGEHLAAKLRRGRLSRGDYERTSKAVRSYFGRYAGYAQEYLYYYARLSLGGRG